MTYKPLSGAEPREEVVASLRSYLESDEVPLLGARSSRFEFRSTTIKLGTLLLTNKRLLVAKDKLFGIPKPTMAIDLKELATTGFGPLYGVGPTWEVHFRTERNELAIMYFDGPVEAEAFKDALLHAAASAIQGPGPNVGPTADPSVTPAFRDRLQRLHDLLDALRPMAATDSIGRPFGEGLGLETAVNLVSSRLEGTDDVRQCGRIMAVELIANTENEQVPQQMCVMRNSS